MSQLPLKLRSAPAPPLCPCHANCETWGMVRWQQLQWGASSWN